MHTDRVSEICQLRKKCCSRFIDLVMGETKDYHDISMRINLWMMLIKNLWMTNTFNIEDNFIALNSWLAEQTYYLGASFKNHTPTSFADFWKFQNISIFQWILINRNNLKSKSNLVAILSSYLNPNLNIFYKATNYVLDFGWNPWPIATHSFRSRCLFCPL